MATRYDKRKAELRLEPRQWLVTGVAGFIGSNLLEPLLSLDQEVVGLVNVSGFLNLLVAARDAVVDSFVYAAWRASYGDHSDLGIGA